MGCLQDIHWSSGLFGYFATYSLGNLYASQFFAAAERDLGNLSEQFRRGEFAPLLGWLRQRIHHSGRNLSAANLVHKVTGEPLKSEYLLDHLQGKYRAVYGLK